MMPAFAAEAAEQAAEASLFASAEFWVAVAFVIFVALTARPIGRMLTTALDSRANAIRRELDEARRLREEAQSMLAESKRRQRDADQEAKEIIDEAKAEAGRIRAHARDELGRALQRRREQALARIAQAEVEATRQIRGIAVDVAVSAAAKTLGEHFTGAAGDTLVDQAIQDLRRRMN